MQRIDAEKLKALLGEGKHPAECARILGVNKSTVSRTMKKIRENVPFKNDNKLKVKRKMPPSETELLKKDRFLDIFKQKACNISEACKGVDIRRLTYYTWIEKDSEFRQRVNEARESLVDFAESVFLEKVFGKRDRETKNWITKPETIAQIFFLKCMGKHRGWIEGQEITGLAGGPIEVMITPAIRREKPVEGTLASDTRLLPER